MKPLCASLSSRGKPDACFALPNLAAAPKPVSFCALVALSPAGQGLRLQGFPGTRQCGSITRAMAERSQVCWTPAWQLNGSKSLPHVPGPLLPPPLHQDCSDIHICAGTWGICVHPAGSWWGIPAPSGTLLWEHLPCTLGAAPLLAGCLGEDRKSLTGRAKGTALVWDSDGTGQGRAGARRRGQRSSGCIWAGGSLTFMERNSEKSVVRFLQQDQPYTPGDDKLVRCGQSRRAQGPSLQLQPSLLPHSPSGHHGRWGHLGDTGRNLKRENRAEPLRRSNPAHEPPVMPSSS